MFLVFKIIYLKDALGNQGIGVLGMHFVNEIIQFFKHLLYM